MTQPGLGCRQQHRPMSEGVVTQHGRRDGQFRPGRIDPFVAATENLAHRIGPIFGRHKNIGSEAKDSLDTGCLPGRIVVPVGVRSEVDHGSGKRLLDPGDPDLGRDRVTGAVVHEDVHPIRELHRPVNDLGMASMRWKELANDKSGRH